MYMKGNHEFYPAFWICSRVDIRCFGDAILRVCGRCGRCERRSSAECLCYSGVCHTMVEGRQETWRCQGHLPKSEVEMLEPIIEFLEELSEEKIDEKVAIFAIFLGLLALMF